MKVSVPLVPVYYFERTGRGGRLIYYVPRLKLTSLVRRRRLNAEALNDFPYGLEVDVNPGEYAFVTEKYGFIPPLEARLVQIAFRGLQLTSLDTSTGMINAQFLESYAAEMRPAIDHLYSESSEIAQATEGVQTFDWEQKLEVLLRQFRPSAEKEWNTVPMSKGVNGEELFQLAQLPKLRGRNGNRR